MKTAASSVNRVDMSIGFEWAVWVHILVLEGESRHYMNQDIIYECSTSARRLADVNVRVGCLSSPTSLSH